MPYRPANRPIIGSLVALLAASATPSAFSQPQRIHDVLPHRVSHVIVPQTQGFAIHHGHHQIAIQSVHAQVSILSQTATTTLDIQLYNPASQQAEAVLLLPVPDHAVVTSFLFQGSASEPTAQLLPADEARRTYDSIVAQIRDPALLEFAGYNLIRSSVFPVPPQGNQRVRVTYEQLLPADGERVDYVLPRSESLEQKSPWTIETTIRAEHPISTVYSPSHPTVVTRESDRHVRVALGNGASLQPGHFRLSYLLQRDGLSASLLAYPDPKVGGGYFLLMAGLPVRLSDAEVTIKREVTLVIDRSGSMAGAKMDQAKAAALQVIEGLDDGEAFNIIDYSTAVSAFAPQPVLKHRESIVAARQYLDRLRPGGGTNIHDALVEALRQQPTDSMLPIVLFLTDGLPTVGKTSEVLIRDMVEQGNTHKRRLFTFGVGHDVNAPLLDRLADISRATSTYVLPEEDVELKVASVFKRLYGPVLADIELATRAANGQLSTQLVRELVPSMLPDLFEDDQLILLGQYQHEGPIRFEVQGNYLGRLRKFSFEFDLSTATTRNAFVPRLWASRRIAYLIDEIRQAGAQMTGQPMTVGATIFNDPRYQELTDEILRLSLEFGILTEYTAFLATEGTDLANWESLVAGCQMELNSKAVQTRSGMGALNQSLNYAFQKDQAWVNNDNRYWDSNLERVSITNVQQMADRAFFKRGSQWIDSRVAAKSEAIEPDETIAFGSEQHIALLRELIGQGRQGVLSLRGDILLLHNGRNILVQNTTP